MFNSLQHRIETFIKNPFRWKFGPLALELFQYHFHKNPGYRSFCLRQNQTPQTVKQWNQIPAIPQSAFKQSNLWLTTFPKKEAQNYFETSGTTTAKKGKLFFHNLTLYHLAATYGFRCTFEKRLNLKKRKILFLFLKESPQETPHSSLSYMFGIWKKTFGLASSEFLIKKNRLDFDQLAQKISQSPTPLFLAGTALAFAALMQTEKKLPLPPGSLLMETGGFKGKTRHVKKKKFYRDLSRFFKISDSSLYNEYGMTELFSQAYACGTQGHHIFPPWLRFRILHPETGKETTKKTPGIIELIDLANTQNPLAIQTQDLGIRHGNTLELIGRITTQPRGCSLAAEDIIL